MSNSLIQNSRGQNPLVAYDVATSQSSINLLAFNSDYNVYKLTWDNVTASINGANLKIRVTKSTAPVTSANYDFNKNNKPNVAPVESLNQGEFILQPIATGEASHGYAYIFNSPLATNDYIVLDETIPATSHKGCKLAGTVTLQTASDGLNITISSGTIDTGLFRIFGFGKDQ